MVEPDETILPLLRERRVELPREVQDAESCFASNEVWLNRLGRRADFGRRVAAGEIVLAGYAKKRAAMDTEAPGTTPCDSEPRG